MLFEAIRNEDKRAFAELFDRYWRKAFTIGFSKIHDRDVAEEIVQETFIGLWNKRFVLSFHNFEAYLYTCVKNKCLNYIEAKVIEKKHWDYYKTFLPATDESTERKIAFNDLTTAINSGMARLPHKTRKVFQLNRLEGKSITEIASVLNLSEKAIEYHLTRSLKQLRVHLKDFIFAIALYFL